MSIIIGIVFILVVIAAIVKGIEDAKEQRRNPQPKRKPKYTVETTRRRPTVTRAVLTGPLALVWWKKERQTMEIYEDDD
jgi:hypothetical protein